MKTASRVLLNVAEIWSISVLYVSYKYITYRNAILQSPHAKFKLTHLSIGTWSNTKRFMNQNSSPDLYHRPLLNAGQWTVPLGMMLPYTTHEVIQSTWRRRRLIIQTHRCNIAQTLVYMCICYPSYQFWFEEELGYVQVSLNLVLNIFGKLNYWHMRTHKEYDLDRTKSTQSLKNTHQIQAGIFYYSHSVFSITIHVP